MALAWLTLLLVLASAVLGYLWLNISRLLIADAVRMINISPIGLGFGSDESPSGFLSSRAALIGQWGAIVVLVISLLVMFTTIAGAMIFIRPIDNEKWRIAQVAVAFGALYSLFVCAGDSPPFLTTTTLAGTWTLNLSIAAIAIAGSPKCLPSEKSAAKPRHLSRGSFLKWAGVASATVLLVTFLDYRACKRVETARDLKIYSAGFVPLTLVSQPFQDATIAMEDGHFYQHHGFDFVAMHRALRVDIREGRIEQGGSTITQQLAKNLFLTNDRTLWRKIQEAFYTVALEHELNKQQILALYLNSIDYGMGNRGIGEAAKYYFHTTPDKLTLAESAVLVGLVPYPPQPSPSLIAEHEPQYEDLEKLSEGEQTALNRIEFFFPSKYSSIQVAEAQSIPLDKLIYPYKDAWDRGATDTIPATWHGVDFYYYSDPNTHADINHVSPYLMPELAGFIDQARKQIQLTGIEHLGVYDDRTMRQSESVTSAHAYGQAIDISGFRFRNGSRIEVKNHRNPAVAAKLIYIEALLRKHFDIVVDWRSDPIYHQTHFHCEVRGPRSTMTAPAQSPVAKDLTELLQNLRISPDRYQYYALWRKGVLVRQTHPASCGSASLATVATYYLHKNLSETEAMKIIGTDGNSGIGDENILAACQVKGLHARMATWTLSQLSSYFAHHQSPVIGVEVGPRGGHFVVIIGQIGNTLLISDPNIGSTATTVSDFSKYWGGDTIFFPS